MEFNYFKGNSKKEKIIVILKSNPDYGFKYNELAEITDLTLQTVKKHCRELRDEDIVKITKQKGMYDKVYVVWDGYL